MPNTSADSLLTNVWKDRDFPVDPVWIARQLGLDVIEAELKTNISGALIKEEGKDPVIILNEADSRQRKRFTCAHELGHYIKRTENGEEPDYNFIDYRNSLSAKGTDKEEIFANQFAANLLMPREEVENLRTEGVPPVLMAAHFDVSDDAIRFRLTNLNL